MVMVTVSGLVTAMVVHRGQGRAGERGCLLGLEVGGDRGSVTRGAVVERPGWAAW